MLLWDFFGIDQPSLGLAVFVADSSVGYELRGDTFLDLL